MAQANEAKRNDDLVRLVNKTADIQNGVYDGSVYSIAGNEEIVLRRDIAEHLIRKTSSLTQTGRTYRLEIAELPAGQRQKSPGEFPKMTQENAMLAEENRLLKDKIRELTQHIGSMELEYKKLKKK